MTFTTDAFREGYETLLKAAGAGAADGDEILRTATRIRDGDADSWLREWTATGGSAWADRRYLHAASYYAAPLPLIADTDGSVSEAALCRRERACWDRAVEPLGGERLVIPYEGHSLPGYFFSGGRGARPLIVVDHGGRMYSSQTWPEAGVAARARGYHWMIFDGPGRRPELVEQGLALRPDWEAVITPVVDAMTARPDVDQARMAIIGYEHAGYGVARALAFEHRFAAAALEPGVADVSSSWTGELSLRARQALLARDRTAFEREIHLAGLFDPRANAPLRRCGPRYGAGTPFDVYTRVLEFRLGDEAQRIGTPTLVRPCRRARWPGQARDLHSRLRGEQHSLATENAFDWFDRHFARAS